MVEKIQTTQELISKRLREIEDLCPATSDEYQLILTPLSAKCWAVELIFQGELSSAASDEHLDVAIQEVFNFNISFLRKIRNKG